MGGRCTIALPILALFLVDKAEAQDRGQVVAINLPPGQLANTLADLSVRTGVGILFSPGLIGNQRNARLTGRMTLVSALDRLLAGTDLTYRRTSVGTYVIERRRLRRSPPALEPLPPPPELVIPEILVTGRRTLNADIRRTRNDIQPYQVFTAREIVSSHTDNVDQFLRSRLTSNAVLIGPSQDPSASFASNRSEVNLHGLGARQTLILVDGIRMPSVPNVAGNLALNQPDLNGIPLAAIERIEALTATAGGIYGPGATAGVVNIVLRRDYRGADIALTSGISGRGDAPRGRFDARIGFTPNDGRTNLMVSLSRAAARGLQLGERDYAVAARSLVFARDPLRFVSFLASTFPSSEAVSVRSISASPLSLQPAFGGTQLASSFTYLPIGMSGSPRDVGAVLAANAGRISETLGRDAAGTRRNLTSDTRVTSILANVRHRFGDAVEAYVDLLAFENDGRAGASLGAANIVGASAPTNPFRQTVLVSYPTGMFDGDLTTRQRSWRLSSGLIAQLPHAWKAEAHYSVGGLRVRSAIDSYSASPAATTAIITGLPVTPGGPVLNPFDDYASFASLLSSYRERVRQTFGARDTFEEASLRLAGPVLEGPAGPIALTLLGQRRREEVPEFRNEILTGDDTVILTQAGFLQTVWSFYGELRTPVVSRDSEMAPMRGLELQLAVRYDDVGTRLPLPLNDPPRARQAGLALTAGFRVYPRDNLMLRASYATGTLPPTPFQLESRSVTSDFPAVPDPRRGGRLTGSEARYTWYTRGSLDVESERARSLSAGLVINPEGGSRLRASIDLTYIRKTNEVTEGFSGNVAYFVANESLYPDRIVRTPLTAADIAAGYTGGVISEVDATFLNSGRTSSLSVDLQVDYEVEIGRWGSVGLHAAATWQPRLERRVAPAGASVDYVGLADGPLRWRGNLGINWRRGDVSVGLNGQYYGSYFAVSPSAQAIPVEPNVASLRGEGVSIEGQFYLDLSSAYRINLDRGPAQSLELRFGISNLTDRRPPTATNTPLGYSYYGDPRRRRFELTVAAHF